jgi:hypothetical protein
MSEVVLVFMPFGHTFLPSLALSLLKAGLTARRHPARVHHFSLGFAQRIGQHFYSGISTYSRPSHRHLVGEWIFAKALFGRRTARDRPYLDEVLPRETGSPPTAPPRRPWFGRILDARDRPTASSTNASSACSRRSRAWWVSRAASISTCRAWPWPSASSRRGPSA